MKALVLLVALAFVIIGCAAEVAPAPVNHTQVHAWREFATTLHVDTEFLPADRADLTEASRKWRTLSGGHVRIDVVFDLDFDSNASVIEHGLGKHDLVVLAHEGTRLADEIDQIHPTRRGMQVRALWVPPSTNAGTRVYFVSERIPREDFLSVATHEFGHVFGLDDLPSFGSVMSGVSLRGAAPVDEFTADDVALCRAMRFCD